MSTNTHVDRLHALTDCFADGRGALRLNLRSDCGFGQKMFDLNLPVRAGLPLPLLKLLADGWAAAVIPYTSDGDLPILIASWRPPARADRDGRYHVVPEAKAAITAALARAPQPSFVVDAGPEVTAGWRLDAPIRDRALARAPLAELSRRLGSNPIDDDRIRTIGCPVSGPIRDWAERPQRFITILAADATRRYGVDELLSAIEENSHVEKIA